MFIFLLNAGFILLVGAGGYMMSLAPQPGIALFLAAVIVLVLALYIGVAALMTRDIANYQSPELGKIPEYFKQSWKASCMFGGVVILQVLMFIIVIPWYLSLKTLFGLAVASLLFWINVAWWLAGQYYFPILGQLDTKITKIFRKSFLFLFDNLFFTIALAIGMVILMLLSGLVVFLMPGLGTILLWHQIALKLRLYKYDYLEAHPNANRRKIPWQELLHEDQERVGKRTLRGLIFPWKE